MAESMNLSVDTGSVLIDINDNGEVIGQFRFNPNDFDIVKRCEKVIADLDKLEMPEADDVESFFRCGEIVKELFDYLLNYKVSDDIFAKCNPLTLLANGDFYFETVLDGIYQIIEKTMNTRLKKRQAKIKKATQKYHN
jgi:hypothetical protein